MNMEPMAETPADNHDAKLFESDALLVLMRDLVAQIEGEKNLAAQKLNELKSIKEGIDSQQTQLKSDIEAVRVQKAALQTVVDEVSALKNTAEQNRNSVQDAVNTIDQARQNFEGLRSTAQTKCDELNAKYAEYGDLATKINEIKNAHEQIERQRKVLLDDQTDDQGNTIKSIFNQVNEAYISIKDQYEAAKRDSESIRQEIAKHQKLSLDNINVFITDQEKKVSEFVDRNRAEVDSLKNELENKILSLLPTAGAAGLASTYYDAKSKYAPTPLKLNNESNYKWMRYTAHFIKGYAGLIIPYITFLAPLAGIVYIFWSLLEKIKPEDIHFEVLIFRSLISLPLITISLFGWSSIRLNRRLYEEYNHKERVMQLYHSFKNEVVQHGNEEHTKMLLEIMLKAVGDKPSLAMHRYDGGLGGIAPRNLIENFFNKKSGNQG
jgi:hypothetical protein